MHVYLKYYVIIEKKALQMISDGNAMKFIANVHVILHFGALLDNEEIA